MMKQPFTVDGDWRVDATVTPPVRVAAAALAVRSLRPSAVGAGGEGPVLARLEDFQTHLDRDAGQSLERLLELPNPGSPPEVRRLIWVAANRQRLIGHVLALPAEESTNLVKRVALAGGPQALTVLRAILSGLLPKLTPEAAGSQRPLWVAQAAGGILRLDPDDQAAAAALVTLLGATLPATRRLAVRALGRVFTLEVASVALRRLERVLLGLCEDADAEVAVVACRTLVDATRWLEDDDLRATTYQMVAARRMGELFSGGGAGRARLARGLTKFLGEALLRSVAERALGSVSPEERLCGIELLGCLPAAAAIELATGALAYEPDAELRAFLTAPLGG